MVVAPPIRFGTDGWRAVIADAFTVANVRLVAEAISEYLIESGQAGKRVAVGHDARFMAERFSREAAAVLAANGLKPLLPDRDVPTPEVASGVIDGGLAGALMFTASHNPPEYNGIKFIPDYGGPASTDITAAIETKIGAVAARGGEARREGGGEIGRFEPAEAYGERLRRLIDFASIRAARLKLAVDPMYGSGRHWLGPLLREAGAHVVSLHDRRDALFGGMAPEPLAAQLSQLSEQVTAGGADLGLATDGDADRFGVIDADGRYLAANAVLALVLDHLVEERGMAG
ncbi:MAG TPA: phosphoglucomutase/phosphomannomutase family protein, partial [Limnochordia bacterium]